MKLEQTHENKFKVKSICTNQKMKWLMQIKTKWCTNESCATQLIKHTMTQTWEEFITFLFIEYIVSNGGHYVEMGKNLEKVGQNFFIFLFCQVVNLTTLWTFNSHIQVPVEKYSKEKL